MGGFFKGWRRKIGIVTLLMACVFAGGWVRSFHFGDCVLWNSMMFSSHGNLYCVPPQRLTMSWERPEWSVVNVASADIDSSFGQVTWQWRLMGFGIGVFTIFRTDILVILFPYYSIVIPLTLLSAYLLISRRRPEKPLATPSPQ